MLTEAELDPYFDAIRREAFRLEALPAYAVSSESRACVPIWLASRMR